MLLSIFQLIFHFLFLDQMFQKYQPKKPPLNPFEEEEEEEIEESNLFKDDAKKPVNSDHSKEDTKKAVSNVTVSKNNVTVSKNPFEEESDTVLDLLNPFNEADDSPSSSLERPHRYKKKKAPAAPSSKGKSQTLPTQLDKRSGAEDKSSEKNRLSLPLKTSKKKAPARPLYEGTPPPSPEEQRRSRPITPPSTEPDTDSSLASTPSSV